MDIDRMARCIVALATAMGDVPAGAPPGVVFAATKHGLKNGHPTMERGKDAINAIINAYFQGENREVEEAARALIHAIAKTNTPKRFVLPVLEGPGVGRWECIIKPVDTAKETPAIIRSAGFKH